MRQRGRRKTRITGQEIRDRWMITYADLITLLLIFFVILYAMSSLDGAKYGIVTDSLSQSFRSGNSVLDGGNGVFDSGQGKTPTAESGASGQSAGNGTGAENGEGSNGSAEPSARELAFKETPEKRPRLATYKVKWDPKYRERWGIDYGFATNLQDGLAQRIVALCKRIYRVLDLSGYARIDLRMTADGELYVLEANPNPGIARDEDSTLSAKKAGIGYKEFIQTLLQLGLHAHGHIPE